MNLEEEFGLTATEKKQGIFIWSVGYNETIRWPVWRNFLKIVLVDRLGPQTDHLQRARPTRARPTAGQHMRCGSHSWDVARWKPQLIHGPQDPCAQTWPQRKTMLTHSDQSGVTRAHVTHWSRRNHQMASPVQSFKRGPRGTAYNLRWTTCKVRNSWFNKTICMVKTRGPSGTRKAISTNSDQCGAVARCTTLPWFPALIHMHEQPPWTASPPILTITLDVIRMPTTTCMVNTRSAYCQCLNMLNG